MKSKRVNVEVNVSDWRMLRKLAISRGVSVPVVLGEAIKSYLGKEVTKEEA